MRVSSSPSESELDGLFSQLSLKERLSLIAGHSTWRSGAIDRVGIPNLKFSDGPSGARGEIFGEGVPAAFLPSGVSLGATWDEQLIFEVGELIAEECKSKSASVILAPTMCIHRHPLGGRNFESFSEDPFLTGKLAAAHVRGVQSKGIGATPKHFVANDQETNRFHVNATIPTRVLREVYLLPFQMVVRDANPWCIMTAYNKVNGYHCDMSKELQIDIARKEWGWDGVFLSDWGGTNSSTDSINAGLDLEMPGPPSKREASKIEIAISKGEIDLQRINQSARRMLTLLARTGRFKDATDRGEVCLNTPEQRAKLHQVACAGMVLLKNTHNALPLKTTESLKKIAILGPNAKRVVAGGGGSAYIKAPYWTSVYDSMCGKFEGQPTKFVHAVGAKMNRYLPTPSAEVARNPLNDEPGAVLDWFLCNDTECNVVVSTAIYDLYYMSFGVVPVAITAETDFGFWLRTILKPLSSGRHRLSLASIGPADLYINGEKLAAVSGSFDEKGGMFFTYGSPEVIFEKDMIAGQDYNVEIKYLSHNRQLQPEILDRMDPMEDKFQGVRLGFEESQQLDLPLQAADIARDCDAAILVVGRDREWETEGEDIPIFELPGEQVRLIEETVKVCKRTIVIVQAGSQMKMEPWIHNVQGVIYAWYQGQELGNAAVSVICGEFNPSGRLPITFPRRIEDCPAFSSFPGEQNEIFYSEGLHVGYRWWDLHKITPLFPIGFGLSYTEFAISNSFLASLFLRKYKPLNVETDVQNVGNGGLPGRETVLVWCSQVSKRRLTRPVKLICGFAKTPLLKYGETHHLSIKLDIYGFGMFDSMKGTWVVDKDSKFDVLVGTNAINSVVIGTIHVPEEICWTHSIK